MTQSTLPENRWLPETSGLEGAAPAAPTSFRREAGRVTGSERLEVVGFQAGVLGDAGQHARTNFLCIVESKNEIKKSLALQGAM